MEGIFPPAARSVTGDRSINKKMNSLLLLLFSKDMMAFFILSGNYVFSGHQYRNIFALHSQT